MWLLLGLCLTSSSLIHSVQMLKCYVSSSNGQTPSLTTCSDNQYCAIIKSYAGGSSVFMQSCVPATSCYYLASGTLSYNIGYFNMTLSCCNTDGCNNGNLPEQSEVPNGLKCDSCNSITDKQCNTPLSCVGIQTCCINWQDSSSYGGPADMGNVPMKGCASKNICDLSSSSKPVNKSKSWLRDPNFSLLLMSFITVMVSGGWLAQG